MLCCYGNCYYGNIVLVAITPAMLLANIHTVVIMRVLWYCYYGNVAMVMDIMVVLLDVISVVPMVILLWQLLL